MAQNYILLETIELNASAASVTFDNIPQTGYTDLKLVFSARDDNAAVYNNMLLTFNGSTTGYSERVLGGTGSAAFSSSQSASSLQYQYINSATSTANSFSNGEFYIPNYTSSNNKSVSVDNVQENNATSAVAGLAAQLWENSAAITTIKLEPASSKLFQQYSTFSLYGLAALGTTPAIAPKASGGNIIDYDGTYWIHTFNASGTFTPQTGLSCEYLVIAGGGGGGGRYGSGGGAGGYLTASGYSVAASTAYTVTVGAGGAGAVADVGGSNGSKGSDSVFDSITSTGGGYGVTRGGAAISSGGSGGGAGWRSATAGTGTAGQGNDGGVALSTSTDEAQAGGGGAGATGGTPGAKGPGNAQNGGAGGNGLASSITGTSVTRAGGGGGGGSLDGTGSAGVGGTGGGGNGTTNTTPATSGTVNTGGGGGGCGNTGGVSTGGTGGSGVVIIRYLAA